MFIQFSEDILLAINKIVINDDVIKLICDEKILEIHGRFENGANITDLFCRIEDRRIMILRIKDIYSLFDGYFHIEKLEWKDNELNNINKTESKKGGKMLSLSNLKEKFVSFVNMGIDLITGRIGIPTSEGLLIMIDIDGKIDLISSPLYKELELPAIRVYNLTTLKKGSIIQLNDGNLAFFLEKEDDNRFVVLKQDGSLQKVIMKKDLILQEGIKAVALDLGEINPLILLLLDKRNDLSQNEDFLFTLMLLSRANDHQQSLNSYLPFFIGGSLKNFLEKIKDKND